MTRKILLTLQIFLGVDEPTIQEWLEIVQEAYPEMNEFSLCFLRLAMGGLKSTLDAGFTAQEWIADTHKLNSGTVLSTTPTLNKDSSKRLKDDAIRKQ